MNCNCLKNYNSQHSDHTQSEIEGPPTSHKKLEARCYSETHAWAPVPTVELVGASRQSWWLGVVGEPSIGQWSVCVSIWPSGINPEWQAIEVNANVAVQFSTTVY